MNSNRITTRFCAIALVFSLMAALSICFADGNNRSLPTQSLAYETYAPLYYDGSKTSAYFEHGQLRVYVKDIYADELGIYMQATLLDKDNAFPAGYKLSYSYKTADHTAYMVSEPTTTAINPWVNLTAELPSNFKKRNHFDVTIGVYDNNDTRVMSKKIAVDLNALHALNYKVFNLNKPIITKDFKLNLQTFTFIGNYLIVDYKLDTSKRTANAHVDFQFTTAEGINFSQRSMTLYSDAHREIYAYDGNLDTVKSMNIKLNGINYNPIEAIGPLENNRRTLTYLGREFNLTRVDPGKKHSQYSYTLATKRAIPLQDFPRIELRNSYTHAVVENMLLNNNFFEINQNLYNKIANDYGIDKQDSSAMASKMKQFVATQYDKKLDMSSLEKAMQNMRYPEIDTTFVDLIVEPMSSYSVMIDKYVADPLSLSIIHPEKTYALTKVDFDFKLK